MPMAWPKAARHAAQNMCFVHRQEKDHRLGTWDWGAVGKIWRCTYKCSIHIWCRNLKSGKRRNLALLFLQIGIKTENPSKPLSYLVTLISS